MEDRIADLEARLADVERRLRALEGEASGEPAYDRADLEPTLGDGFVASASTHIGRVLLIFGGAFLLRAITDYEFVPTAIGILMGATYAMFWLFMAYRRGRIESERASAAFFGGTSVLLALPLLVEAITKFELLSGRQGVLALAVYFVAAALVAVLRDLKSLGWLVTAGSVGTAVAVLAASHEALVAAAFLLFLGLGTLWAVYLTRWLGLQWLGAIGANAGVLSLLVFSHSDQWPIGPGSAAWMAIIALLVYLASFAVRSHVRGESVGLFEPVQVIVGGALAFWAIRSAAAAGEVGLTSIGVQSTVLGVLAYALAMTAQSRKDRKQNFFYYTTLGLVLIIAGTASMLPLIWAASIWCLMALSAAWFSGRAGWVTLSLQCTFLLLAAGVGSGLLATGWQALAGSASGTWPEFPAAHLGIALTTVACLFIPVAQSSDRWGVLAGLPQLIVLTLSVWEVGGLMVAILAPLLAGAGSPEPNAAILAALRTAVLSVSSVTLALSSRFPRWPEARWLVYPVLILVAIKLFVEDFPNGQPATLFVALAFVGSALLLVARLIRRSDAASQGL